MEIDKIYNRDCLEGMREVPSGSIDLVIADPPYQIDADDSGGCFGRKRRSFHSEIDNMKAGIGNEYLEEMVRVCKIPNIYLFCSKNQLPQFLNFAVEKGMTFDLLTWHKLNPVPTCNNKWLSDTEYIVFMRKGAPIFGNYETKRKFWVTQVNKSDKEKWHHPTIKPLQIVKSLIINSVEGGGIVLDPFIGSGTTAVACIQEQRHFIGFEIDEKYYKTATERIKLAMSEPTLF